MVTTAPILVGEIVRAHGIKGHIVVHSFCQNPADIENYELVFDEVSDHIVKLHIIKNLTAHTFVVSFPECCDRNQAETLTGTRLYAVNLPELQPGEFYQGQFQEFTAIANGTIVGKVLSLDDFGAGSFFTIKKSDKSLATLPFTHDCVHSIDWNNKTLAVDKSKLIE